MNLFDILSYRRGHLSFVVWDSVKLVCWSGRICKTVNGWEGVRFSDKCIFRVLE